MNFVVLTAAALMALAGAAAAETRQIPVSQITEVEAAGRFAVEIVQGAEASAALDGSAADLARVTARTNGGKLIVTDNCRLNCGNQKLDVTLRVTAPGIQAISASRGVRARATGLATTQLELDAAMGATVTAEGRCTTLDAEARMGGVIEADKLTCHVATVRTAMGGVAEVHADQSLTARASMGGVVEVKGAPATRNTSASMGGVIDLN